MSMLNIFQYVKKSYQHSKTYNQIPRFILCSLVILYNVIFQIIIVARLLYFEFHFEVGSRFHVLYTSLATDLTTMRKLLEYFIALDWYSKNDPI